MRKVEFGRELDKSLRRRGEGGRLLAIEGDVLREVGRPEGDKGCVRGFHRMKKRWDRLR